MEKSSKAKEISLKGKYVLYLMDIRMNITALIMIFNTKLWIKIRSNVLSLDSFVDT